MGLLDKFSTQGSLLSSPNATPYSHAGILNPESLEGSNLDLPGLPDAYDSTKAKTPGQWLDGSNLDPNGLPTRYSSTQLG